MFAHSYYRAALMAVLLSLAIGSRVGADSQKAGDAVTANIALLERYVAIWRATEHHFNALGEQIATVKSTEQISWILNRRAIRRVYTTVTKAIVSYTAIGTLTWNAAKQQYDGVWFDTTSLTGPSTVKAQWNRDERTMTYTLTSSSGDGKTLRHKVVEKFPDDDNRTSTTYLLADDDRVVKVLEVVYQRTAPCPTGRMRTIDELTP